MNTYILLFSTLNHSGLEIQAFDMDDARFIARQKMQEGIWNFVAIKCESRRSFGKGMR